jgi:hypothetical protein
MSIRCSLEFTHSFLPFGADSRRLLPLGFNAIVAGGSARQRSNAIKTPWGDPPCAAHARGSRPLRAARPVGQLARSSTGGIARERGRAFLNAKYDIALAALNRLHSVTGRRDQMRNVDRRHRVAATHFEPIARSERFEGFARSERRQRTLQSQEVQPGDDHRLSVGREWFCSRPCGRASRVRAPRNIERQATLQDQNVIGGGRSPAKSVSDASLLTGTSSRVCRVTNRRPRRRPYRLLGCLAGRNRFFRLCRAREMVG